MPRLAPNSAPEEPAQQTQERTHFKLEPVEWAGPLQRATTIISLLTPQTSVWPKLFEAARDGGLLLGWRGKAELAFGAPPMCERDVNKVPSPLPLGPSFKMHLLKDETGQPP